MQKRDISKSVSSRVFITAIVDSGNADMHATLEEMKRLSRAALSYKILFAFGVASEYIAVAYAWLTYYDGIFSQNLGIAVMAAGWALAFFPQESEETQ